MEKKLSFEKKLPEGKTFSFGKLAGIIFCVLAGICTVILLFVSSYFSGQMKTVDKFFTSLTREDINGFRSCVPEDIADRITEHYLERADGWLKEMLDGEAVKAEVKFQRREKHGDGYIIYFDLTLYNDHDHITEQDQALMLIREGMKWVVSPEW